jgi:hypothetical protein
MKTYSPKIAWNTYLSLACRKNGWLRLNNRLSNDFSISNRELLSLIVLSKLANHISKTDDWMAGYDPYQGEPNDGLVTNNKVIIKIESKYIPEIYSDDALKDVVKEYNENNNKGSNYGNGYNLVIFCNKQELIELTPLKEAIANSVCNFDSVLFIYPVVVDYTKFTFIIHVHEYYPAKGFASVEINVNSGDMVVKYSNLETLPKLM